MKYVVCFALICTIFTSALSQKSRIQKGYVKSNGTVVQPHYKTESNKTNHDNYSTKPNSNPYTGKSGSHAKDYSLDVNNYGKQKTVQKGPQGGNYYYNDKQKKIYIPKRY